MSVPEVGGPVEQFQIFHGSMWYKDTLQTTYKELIEENKTVEKVGDIGELVKKNEMKEKMKELNDVGKELKKSRVKLKKVKNYKWLMKILSTLGNLKAKNCLKALDATDKLFSLAQDKHDQKHTNLMNRQKALI